MNERFAHASNAGYSIYPNMEKRTFILSFDGFNEKMETLIEMALKEVKRFIETMDEAVFETQKAAIKRRYFNGSLNSDDLLSDVFDKVICESFFTDYELYKEIDNITFEDLQKFVHKFFQKLKIQVLVQGNLRRSQAINILSLLKANFECEPLDGDSGKIAKRVFTLPSGINTIRMKSFMQNDDNSCLKNYYQFGPASLRTRNLNFLISSALETKAFDYLRNKEQLGYRVGSSYHTKNGIIGFVVFVSSQEQKHSYSKVLEKMEIFMRDIANKTIEELSDEEFESFKSSRLKSVSAEVKTLREDFNRNWEEIAEQEYIFDRYELSAKVIKSITKSDIQEYFKSFTQPENMRKLSIQVIGNEKSEEKSTDNSKERELNIEIMTEKLSDDENLVNNIEEFKSNLTLYPEVKFHIE